MLKFILVFAVGFMPLTGTVEKPVDASWSTVCSYNLDGKLKIWAEIRNIGAKPFTDCRLQKWVGPSETDWTDAGVSIPGCADLQAGDALLWSMVKMEPKNRVRIQAKSAGTKTTCQLFRKSNR